MGDSDSEPDHTQTQENLEDSDPDEIMTLFRDAGGAEASAAKPKRTPKRPPTYYSTTPKANVVIKQLPPHVVGLSPAGYSPNIDVHSEKYGNRAQSGNVTFHYKCKNSDTWNQEQGQERKITTLEPTSDLFRNNKFMYMFQKVPEMALAMDYVVQTLGMETLEKLEKSVDGVEPELARQSLREMCVEETKYIGRIRSDGGKLTCDSVKFEGCMEDSKGHIVRLDLSSVEEYHIFPGQVAVIEGKNEPQYLRVSKIHLPSPPPFKNITINRQVGPLNILVAAGPFTPVDSLQYEPLKDMIAVIKKTTPDICILIGPFIEATHAKIQEGIAEPFDELFDKQMEFLKNEISECSTKVVIVPSYKDVHGEYVYPTPPFPSKSKPSEKIVMLTDPATISVGGVVIGMTSVDVIMHLKQNELTNSLISGDAMGGLARHLLSQQSFYPIFPADVSVPLDVEQFVRYGRMETRPHILIVPSNLNLKPLIKDVDGTIVINPQRLSSCGGTYARIQIDFTAAAENENYSSIADLCVGEIVKI